MKTQSVVRDRAATLASSVFRSKFIVGLMLVPFFKSSFYDSFGMLSDLSNYVLIVETIILILMAFVCEYRSRILIAVGAYFAWTSFIAPALGGSISPGVYYMFEALGFSVLVLLGLRSSGLAFLNALSGWFCFLTAVNLALVLLFPTGYSSTANGAVWLFGIRTGFPLVLIPAIGFCCLYDCARNRGVFSLRTWITLIVSVASIVNQWIATGIIELTAFFIMYTCVVVTKRLPVHAIVTSVSVIGFVVVVFGPSSFLGGLLDMLGRDMTFTGRTDIWAATLAEISSRPIFGYGGIAYVIVHGSMKAFHCLWLSIAHESGLVGLAIYAIPFSMAAKRFHAERSNPPAQICAMVFIAMLVASFVEIQTYFPFIYGVLVLSELVRNCPDVFKGNRLPVPMKLR